MKFKFANVALVLVSGLVASAPAFAQATPKQMPAAMMAGPAGGKMMADNKMMAAKRDESMGMHTNDSRSVAATLNPKIRVY